MVHTPPVVSTEPSAENNVRHPGSSSFLSRLKAFVEAIKLYFVLLGLIAGVSGAVLRIATRWGSTVMVCYRRLHVAGLLILIWLIPAWIDQNNGRLP
jgi:hypothetical protein